MKKIISLLLVAVMVFSMAACGKKGEDGSGESNSVNLSNEEQENLYVEAMDLLDTYVSKGEFYYAEEDGKYLYETLDATSTLYKLFSQLEGYKSADEILKRFEKIEAVKICLNSKKDVFGQEIDLGDEDDGTIDLNPTWLVLNDNNMVIEEYSYKSCKTYSYDEKGNMVQRVTTYRDGEIVSKITMQYDEKGNCIYCKDISNSGVIETNYTYQYDAQGRVIQGPWCEKRWWVAFDSSMYNVFWIPDGDDTNRYNYTYDEQGNIISRAFWGDGEIQDRFFYDEEGNVTRHEIPDYWGKQTTYRDYVYENGKVVKIIETYEPEENTYERVYDYTTAYKLDIIGLDMSTLEW